MQESGVPNIWGELAGAISSTHNNCTGIFRGWRVGNGEYNGNYNAANYNVDGTRVSNQYQNNLNEVRMKNICSNGFIKLY